MFKSVKQYLKNRRERKLRKMVVRMFGAQCLYTGYANSNIQTLDNLMRYMERGTIPRRPGEEA